MKLDIKAMAIAGGLVWGVGIFLGTWWIILLDGASNELSVLGQIYRGHSLTALGSLLGLMWGLVDGAIGGALIAWLYNRFAKP